MKEKILLGLLEGVARLPLRVLYLFSDLAFLIIYHMVKYRREVVRANLTSAFPEKSLREIKRIEREYYRYLADQIVETVKILHISDKELQKRVTVANGEIINRSLKNGKNCVLLMAHYANWEWVQEVSRYFIPGTFMASIYRPLNSKTWDNIYKKLRSRWHNPIVAMNRATRVLLNRDNFPWVCGFIADQRPDRRHDDNCVEFLNHKTWFIYGPEEIGNKVGADFFYLEMIRKRRGIYEISLHQLNAEGEGKPYPHSREFWRRLEDTIRRYPAYWLWSHKRWK